MVALIYEGFVRGSFSLDLPTMIDRSQDPAGVAEADYWRSGNLSKVKVGTAYAVAAYGHRIQETSTLEGEEYDQLYHVLDSLLNRSLEASSLEDLESIIEEARTYVNQYIVFQWSS